MPDSMVAVIRSDAARLPEQAQIDNGTENKTACLAAGGVNVKHALDIAGEGACGPNF